MADRIQVLCVDDEADLLEIGKVFLEGSGDFSVDTAVSATEALDILSKKNYDAIVSDYHMPVMDGIEFLKKVRSADKTIPFIMLTGRGWEEIVIEALNNGANFYLQKGGDPDIFYMELSHVLRQFVVVRRTQVTLAEQEQRYHDLQNANDLIQSVAPDGHFLFVNKKWLDTLGYREDELPNLTIFDVIHEESLKHCMETFRQVISGETVGIIDAVFLTRDGRKVYVEGMASCMMVDGQPQYTRGIFKDVTDRKKAERELLLKNEELRASEEIFRKIFENSAIGMTLALPDSRFFLVNPAWVSLMGYTEEEFQKLSFKDITHPEDLFQDIESVSALAAGTIPVYNTEKRYIKKDGSTLWGALKLVTVRNKDGTLRYYLAQIEDITPRKLAEEALRQSEEKLSLVMNGIPTLISYMDSELRFVYVNKAHSDWYGLSEKDLVGKSLKDLLPEDVFLHALPYYQQALSGREVSFENSTRDKEGRERLLNVRLVPHVHGNHVVGFFAALEDITERKNAEAAFQAMVRSMASTTGFNSLRVITENVSSWLGADCVMVGELQPDKTTVKALSMLLDGKEVPGFSYTLKGSPCEEASEKGFCMYQDNVRKFFPDARDLVDLNIRGYVGTSLRNSAGEVMGILCVLSRKPVQPVISLKEIMEIIAVKAAAEIERTRIMAALKESEENFHSMFERHDSIMLLIEPETGNIIDANFAAERFYGRTRKELCTSSIEDINTLPPEVVAAEREKAVRGEVTSFIFPHRIAGEEIRTVEVHSTPIAMKGKTILFSIINDITERRQAEEALRQANRKLNLLSSVTRHDIKNQLLALQSYLGISKDSLANPDEMAKFIAKEEKIAETISHQISFTKDYEEMGMKVPAWQNVSALVRKIIARLPMRDIRVDAGDPAVEVFADPLLEKVFYNLFDNALRYGGGRMTSVRVSNYNDNGGLVIRVEDDGVGISMEDKNRLFTKGFGKHTGLGLYLSREILSITGISITENGEPGSGAQFGITVPKDMWRKAGSGGMGK